MERVGVVSIRNGYIRVMFVNDIQRHFDIYIIMRRYIIKPFRMWQVLKRVVVYSCLCRNYDNGKKHRAIDMLKKERK